MIPSGGVHIRPEVPTAFHGLGQLGGYTQKQEFLRSRDTHNLAKSITLSGGYGPNFELPLAGSTSTISSLTIVNGTMEVRNIVIAQ